MLAGVFAFSGPTSALIVLQTRIATMYGPGGASFAALALSLLGLSATVPTLLAALVSGTLADRYDRPRLLRGIGLASVVAVGAITAILAADPRAAIPAPGAPGFTLPLWLLLVFPVWASLTAAVTIFRPAFNSALPRLVSTGDLGRANGLLYAFTVAVSSATQVLTGLLAAHGGTAIALAVPLALFALSELLLWRVGPAMAGGERRAPGRFLTQAKEGYRYLWHRREILLMTVGALGVNFLSALAFVELAEYSTFSLHQGPEFLGFLYAAGTLGAGGGALAINRIRFERHVGRISGLFTIGMGACVAGLALTRVPVIALGDMFLFGMFPGMFQIAFVAGVQATVPSELLGRVFAADEVGSFAFVPVGQYAGGLLTVATGIETTYLGAGAGMGLIGLAMFLSPAARLFRFEPAADRPPVAARPVDEVD